MGSPHDILHDLQDAPHCAFDPGTAAAIVVTRWGHTVPLTIAGTETNTLANPTGPGMRVKIVASVVTSGTRAVTVAAAFNASGNTILTFDTVGDMAILESYPAGLESDGKTPKYRWKLLSSDGVALS